MSENESHESTIARGAGFVFVGTFVGMGVSFLVRIFLIRELPKAEYGLFALGLSTVGLAVTFGTLGLKQGVARTISRTDTDSSVRDTILTALSSVLLVTLVISAVMFVFADPLAKHVFREPGFQPYLKLLAALVPATAVQAVVVAVFRGKKRVQERIVVQNLVAPVGRALLAVVAVLLGYGTLGAAAGWVAGLVVSMLVGLLYLYRRTDTFYFDSFSPQYRTLLTFSLPLMIGSATWTVVQQADNYLLGFFGTSSNVAVYDGTFLLSRLLLVVLGSFGFLFMPVFSELDADENLERMRDVYHSVTEWATLLVIPVYVGMLLAPELVLSTVFRPSYAAGTVPLTLIASGFFFHILSGSSGNALIALGRNRVVLVGNVAASVLNVALNLVLIPRYGIVGAAAASAFAYVLFNLYYLVWLVRLTGIYPFSLAFLKPVLLCLTAVSAVWLSVTYLAGSGIFTLVTCLLLSFAVHTLVVVKTKPITPGDERLLMAIESKTGFDIQDKIGLSGNS